MDSVVNYIWDLGRYRVMDGTMDLTGKTELELRAMEREIAK